MLSDPKSFTTLAAFTVLCYDYLLTFRDEVELVWSRRFTLGTALFLFNRYLPFVDMPISLRVFSSSGDITAEQCRILTFVSTPIILLGIVAAEGILILRTLAIWDKNRYVIYVLLGFQLLTTALAALFTGMYLKTIQFIAIPGQSCVISYASPIIFADLLTVLILESVIVILTTIRAVHHLRHSSSSWVHQLYSRGIFYFFLIFILALLNVLFPLLAKPSLKLIFLDPQRAFHSILCNRVLFLILRQKRPSTSRHGTFELTDLQKTNTAFQFALDLETFTIPDEADNQTRTTIDTENIVQSTLHLTGEEPLFEVLGLSLFGKSTINSLAALPNRTANRTPSTSLTAMSAAQPLLHTIEADEPDQPPSNAAQQQKKNAPPVVLTPTTRTNTSASGGQMATNQGDAESGISGIFRQSAHPLSLFFLYFFRLSAIGVYILAGWFTDRYVLTTVIVVILLAMDFWNCRNVSGRTLVGLRFWNQVDEDGESFWVFESRDPSRPANPVDSKMFWIALYTFPALWSALLIVSFLKLKLEYVPIVVLALVFNVTNVVGFTYADRDAKQKWANSLAGGWGISTLGGIGGQLITGAVKQGVGRVFGGGGR